MHFERVAGDALELHGALVPEPSPSRSRPTSQPPAPEAQLREQMLRRWLHDYMDYVARVLRSAGIPEQEVDDAVQRTFIVAARRYADVREGSERGFLLKTALHVAAHVRRSAARRREVPTSELPESADLSTPEALASARREQRLVARLVDRLVPELRTVLVLYEVEELTMAEIAATLSIPPGTVASRLRRARRELRERWQAARVATAALGAAIVLHAGRAKALAAAMTLGLVALVVVPQLRSVQPQALVAQAPRVPPAAPVASPRSALTRVAPAAESAAAPAEAAVVRSAPAPSAAAPLGAAKPSAAEALRLELLQLDRARALVASGRAAAALVVLDGYDRSTPRGALKLEAEALRIDALARSGHAAQSRARAADFLAKYPHSVLAARVRQLAAR